MIFPTPLVMALMSVSPHKLSLHLSDTCLQSLPNIPDTDSEYIVSVPPDCSHWKLSVNCDHQNFNLLLIFAWS